MDADQFLDVMRGIAVEIDIPFEQLIRIRYSEPQPVFEFVKLKQELRIEANQKELDRLLLEETAVAQYAPVVAGALDGQTEEL